MIKYIRTVNYITRVVFMLKGLGLYFLLSMLIRNPFLALIILLLVYALMDRAYIGFLPDFLMPFKRAGRIKNLREVLKVNPADANAAQELGIIFFDKKNYAAALDYLKMACKKVKNSPRLYLYLGMTYMEQKQEVKGKEFLEQALELDRRVGHGLPFIYLISYQLNHNNPISEEFRHLTDSFDSFASTENFYRMGMVYSRMGNKERAREMFQQALEEYSFVPGRLRKLHRRWAFLSWLHKFL